MKRVIAVLTVSAALLLSACATNSFLLVMDGAVVASTAAIPACLAFGGTQAQQCMQYAQTVNADAEASIPIASDSSLTKAQIAARLLPIWANVAAIPFPNASPEILALQSAVAGVIQIIELYNSQAQTAKGREHLTVKSADLNKLHVDLDAFKVKRMAH